MANEIPFEIDNNEQLYRGVSEINWDFQNNRPTSATFKDSKGVSVDRCNFRDEKECVDGINKIKNWFAICKVMTETVRSVDAIVRYKKEDFNDYHSEIHDSETRAELRGKKPNRIRENSKVVYLSKIKPTS